MAELARTTGVPVATLKYYAREGLLHPGTATAVNQATYDASHVRRVRLVRALLDLGRLSIADVRQVVRAVEDDALSIHEAFGVAQDAMVHTRRRDEPLLEPALREVDAFLRRHDLHVRAEATARLMLAEALVSLTQFGWGHTPRSAEGVVAGEVFDPFVPALRAQAAFEVSTIPDHLHRSEQVEYTVVGTVVWETAAAAIRRLALEDASGRRAGGPG